MLTGATRPVHAPHALFTPSTGGLRASTPSTNHPTHSIHEPSLCSGRHGRRHEPAPPLLVPFLGTRHSVLDRHFGAMCRVDTPGVLDYM